MLLCLIVKILTLVNYFRLEVRQISEGIHHVPGMVEAPVDNMNEVWEVLQTGSNARAVGSTNCNEHSSRSHWSCLSLLTFGLLSKRILSC